MIVFNHAHEGRQIYDEKDDSWIGSLSDELNATMTLRTQRFPTSHPDHLLALTNEFLLKYPEAVFVVARYAKPSSPPRGAIF